MSRVNVILKAFRKVTGRDRKDVPASLSPPTNAEIASGSSPRVGLSLQTQRTSDFYAPIADMPLLVQLKAQRIALEKISVQALGLTTQLSMELRKANIRTVEQLSNCNGVDLLSIHRVGVTKVKRIKERLNSFLVKMLVTSENEAQVLEQLFELASRFCSIFESYGLLESLRLPSQVRENLREAIGDEPETLADLDRVVQLHGLQAIHPDSGRHIYTSSYALEQGVNWFHKVLGYRSIDDEVNGLVEGFDDRERLILIGRFGVGKRLTLEAIGNQFGITRERVRQIETKMQRRLVSRVARLPFFYSEAAIILLKRLGRDATLDLWKEQLMDMSLLKEESSLNLLLAIGRISNSQKLALPEEFAQLLQTGVPSHIRHARKPVLAKARKFCRNCGAVRVASLTDEKLTEADIEQILFSDGFTELHLGWWMKEVSKYVPERIAKKVIACCGPVPPSSMRSALERHLSRSQLPVPPSRVLVKLLEQTGEFALADGLLQLTSMRARKTSLTGPELVFLRIVRTEGPIVSFESTHTKLLEEAFSTASVTHLLSFSPIVQKVATGLYTLLGKRYDAADIERVRSQITRVSANPSIKPRSDGVIEFETNVGTWMSYGGVLASGPAVAMKGTWTIIADSIKQGELVVEGNFIRGLSKIAESLSIAPGDRIRIEFNTWTREATIRKVVNNEQTC